MADISKVKLPNGNEYNLKDAAARLDIEKLQDFASSGVTYGGVTTTALTDGSTVSSVTIKNGDSESTLDATKGLMVSYNNIMYAYNGSQWDQLGAASPLKELAYKSSVTGETTPSGTVSKPSFTGTKATISVSGTPSGTITAPSFTGTKATLSVSGTPSGSVAVKTADVANGETGNYTPAGEVGVSTTNKTIQQITGVGTLPAWKATVTGETMEFSWDTGTLPTRAGVSVADGIQQAVFTGKATNITSAFTGDKLTSTGDYTPKGTNSVPSFTGKSLTSTGDYTPAGDVSQPTFTGNKATITSK